MYLIGEATLLLLCWIILLSWCNGLQQGNKLEIDSDKNLLEKVLKRLNAVEVKCELQTDENAELRQKVAALETQITALQAENKQMGTHLRVLQTRDQMLVDESRNKERHVKEKKKKEIDTKDGSDRFSTYNNVDDPYKALDVSIYSGVNSSHFRKNLYRRKKRESYVNVAFFATIRSHHLEHLSPNQPLIFDHVITNIGNAYNNHTGDFRAPVSGTYVFSVTLMTVNSGTIHCLMVQNGKGVAYIYLYGTDTQDATSSVTAALELQEGDNLAIHNMLNDVSIHGHGYTYFSGFLLYQDYSNPGIIGK